MNGDAWKAIAATVIAIIQVYGTRSDMAMLFARFWDILARISGHLANILGRYSLIARSNYFTAVTYGA
jgi:hypothetical protein